MELGKKIRQLRFKAGLTQEQLADRLGVAAQSVSKWENAVAMPDITTLPLLAEVFGVSIDDLFDLSAEQRLNRIENRMDAEEDLPHVFERFYKGKDGKHGIGLAIAQSVAEAYQGTLTARNENGAVFEAAFRI